MKRIVAASAMMVVAGAASCLAANCTTATGYGPVTSAAAVLNGNTTCYPTAAPYSNQEFHNAGSLVDYKKGPTDARDPTSTVGSYVLLSSGVIYSYSAGGTYSYIIYGATGASGPGTYDFCTGEGGTRIVVRVKAGSGAC